MKFIKPKKLPEANIQAELYRQLRNNNIKCCLEYRIRIPEFKRNIRADIVVIKDSRIIVIIEVKSRYGDDEINKDSRQWKCYETLNVPIIYCMNFRQVPITINKVLELLDLDMI